MMQQPQIIVEPSRLSGTVTLSGAKNSALALVPAFAQEQETEKDLTDYAGVYEFEAPDYGVIAVTIALTEEKALTISAMGSVPEVLKHISGELYEFESPEFGLINIGFVKEDDGSISAITIDSYAFSFIATKKKQ